MLVDFATYCCPKDIDKIEPVYDTHAASHEYQFNRRFFIYQRCKPVKPVSNTIIVTIGEHEYSDILKRSGINPKNAEADDYTHGWDAAHYWKHHCVNHLTAIHESKADYIVLADGDCFIKSQRGSWIREGIAKLQSDPSVLVVSPSDGTERAHTTQNMSQQMMLVERERFMNINFDLPFEGFRDGGPMQEYYFMLEGRIGRYMEKNGLYRYMLSSQHRYWHSQW